MLRKLIETYLHEAGWKSREVDGRTMWVDGDYEMTFNHALLGQLAREEAGLS